jgi:hypothetical protein
MRASGTFLCAAGLFCAAALFFGCGTAREWMRADPAPVSTFLPDPERLVPQKAAFPFDRLWYDRKIDWERFKKIKVAHVDVSHIFKDSAWDIVNEEYIAGLKKDTDALAVYMRGAFIKAIRDNPKCGLEVTDTVDSGTVVLHLAITQLVPTKAAFNVMCTAADFFIPGASLLTMANAGCIAMEGKITDGKTDSVIAMFTDREKDKAAFINLGSFTWYGNAYSITDDWAKEFAKLAEEGEKAEKPFPFSFIIL